MADPTRHATRRRRGRPSKGPGEASTPVQSLARGLALLRTLAGAENGIALSDLAERAGLPASTTHRLLATLERQRFATLDPDRGLWFVGVEAFSVGNGFLANRDVVAVARPEMRRLMEESGESVNLAILDDGEVVFLSQVQCREMMRMLVRLGGRAPVHASGVGKALLAALPAADAETLVARTGLRRFTDNTITAPAILCEELGGVRERGYAVDDEEHAVGLRCVAATVHDEHGDPIAAVSLSGPMARIVDARVPVLGRLVVRGADRITRAIGGRAPVWRDAAAAAEPAASEPAPEPAAEPALAELAASRRAP